MIKAGAPPGEQRLSKSVRLFLIKLCAVFLIWRPGDTFDRNGLSKGQYPSTQDEKGAQYPQILRFFDSFHKSKQPDPKDREQVLLFLKELKVVHFGYGILIQQLEEMVKK